MEVYICIKNFGKIKEARVNISHFTVFVGDETGEPPPMIPDSIAPVSIFLAVSIGILLENPVLDLKFSGV